MPASGPDTCPSRQLPTRTWFRGPSDGGHATRPVGTATPTPRPPRATRTVGSTTATRTATPRPPVATVTRAIGTSTPTRAPWRTATLLASPTRATQLDQARITVEVSVCIDARFTNTGELGSATDIGPRFLTDIDQSRCRQARGGETRITLTFVPPPTSAERIGTLHLAGPIVAEDAGVRIVAGRTLVIPLTVVVPGPTGSAIRGTTVAGSGPLAAGAAAPGLLLAGLIATRRFAG